MKILLANDDGIFAPGLAAIYRRLIEIAEVTVVAPDTSRSGAGHSITYRHPLVATKVDINGLFTGYSVQGSPADCVKLACMQICKDPIDLLVSGINNGANVGINVYYSGTIGAAMEGAFLGIPSVAMSLAVEAPGVPGDFEKAAGHCLDTLNKLMPVEAGSVINVNIPQLSRGEPRGVRVVPQGSTGFNESYVEKESEHGKIVFQLTGDHHVVDGTPTDATSLDDGYITVTALAPDMTDHKKTAELDQIDF